jgi:phosphoesterase RecJ-like protein
MNYKESKEILDLIKKSDKIVVNLHRGPDGDSVGSALALAFQLRSIGKDVDVILTSTSEISANLKPINGIDGVKKVDFGMFDFSQYDLFISPDSSDFLMVTDNPELKAPAINKVVIDHHHTNARFGDINLIDAKASSCAEIVYKFFKDCGFEVNKEVAQLLLIGIITDTGSFRFANDYNTLINAAELMKLGADKQWIDVNLISTRELNELKVFGEYFRNIVMDKSGKFFYTGIDYEVYKKYGKPSKVASMFATSYGSAVEGTEFGLIITEKKPGITDISLRARGDFDVSGLAQELGGGGHKAAAGGQIKDLDYSDALKKAVETAQKYVKEA